MDGLNEPAEPKKAVQPNDWADFLGEFSARNRDRRARFHIFRNGEMNEEEQEAHFTKASIETDGDKKHVVVERVDRSDGKEETMTDRIENVRGIAVQYETDRSENILELTDGHNHLYGLRFESKSDGAS